MYRVWDKTSFLGEERERNTFLIELLRAMGQMQFHVYDFFGFKQSLDI